MDSSQDVISISAKDLAAIINDIHKSNPNNHRDANSLPFFISAKIFRELSGYLMRQCSSHS